MRDLVLLDDQRLVGLAQFGLQLLHQLLVPAGVLVAPVLPVETAHVRPAATKRQNRSRNDLIASAVILQNTADMMQALRAMVKEGAKADVAAIGFLSPYLTSNIKRFGDYKLNLERLRKVGFATASLPLPPIPSASLAMPDTDIPYGRVDAEALQAFRDTFDTTTILRVVDQLDAIRARCCEPAGLRDDLLRGAHRDQR